jgi:ribosomal-protein-alanine N-acetyltransferase
MTIPLPTLGNEHLYLRPYELADFDDFTDLMARPDLTQHLGGPLSIHEAGQLFHAMTRAYHGSNIEAWAVYLADRDEYIGHAMLRRRLPEDDPEITFVLHEQYWARGVPNRILAELFGYAFDVSRHDRVTCTIEAGALRAMRVLEKAGMKLDYWSVDERGKQPVFAMDRSRWRALSPIEPSPGQNPQGDAGRR